MKKTIKRTATTMKLTLVNIAHSIYIAGYTWVEMKDINKEDLFNDIKRCKEWKEDYKQSKKEHLFTKKQFKQMKSMIDREFKFIDKRMNKLIEEGVIQLKA